MRLPALLLTRAAKIGVSVVVGLALAAGASYGAALLAGTGGDRASQATGGTTCDQDGVVVGYDVGYDQALAAYAVSGVRVIGIAPACDGAVLQLDLADGAGNPLAGGTVTATVAGPTLQVPLPQSVSAESVRRVFVSLEGHTQVEQPDVTPQATTTTAPTTITTTTTAPPLVAVATPSFCRSISGVVSVTGQPADCGAVAAPAAPPAVAGGTAPPAPVVSWPANLFTVPVTVTLARPTAATLPTVVTASAGAPLVVTGTFVQLSVVSTGTRQPITSFTGAMAIDFPPQTGAFSSVYSEDGSTWHTIPRLDAPTLPSGQPDGYFVHPDTSVTVYTRHATWFAVTPPPGQVPLVHTKLLPTGGIRVTWKPSPSALGVASYRLLLNGRVAKTVGGSSTVAVVDGSGLDRASFRVEAVDPVGAHSALSRPAAMRVPLLVGARARPPRALPGPGRSTATVRASVRLTTSSRVRVLVLSPAGERLQLRAGSRVGSAILRRGASQLAGGSRPAGVYGLVLRLPAAKLRPGTVYRIVLLGTAPGRSDRAEIRFAGR